LLINSRSNTYTTLTHNSLPYFPPPQNRGQGEERSSDDGEPGGTAGRPILSAIESEDLVDVMVVVTRYGRRGGGRGPRKGREKREDGRE